MSDFGESSVEPFVFAGLFSELPLNYYGSLNAGAYGFRNVLFWNYVSVMCFFRIIFKNALLGDESFLFFLPLTTT